MNCIINLIKPPGISSNKALYYIKKMTGETHVGHTGTLDPNASGVLPVCIGKTTKLAEYLLCDEKEYSGEITFGMETDTCDSEGKVTAQSGIMPSVEEIKEAVLSFTGDIIQVPPMFSAIKIQGMNAYEYARKDLSISLPERNVNISRFTVNHIYENKMTFSIACSKGTYIRSIARDLGRKLECYAYLSALVRTKSGAFDIAHGYTLQEINEAIQNGSIDKLTCSIRDVLPTMNEIFYAENHYEKFSYGNAILLDKAERNVIVSTEDDPYILYCKGMPIAIAKIVERDEERLIQPVKVLI